MQAPGSSPPGPVLFAPGGRAPFSSRANLNAALLPSPTYLGMNAIGRHLSKCFVAGIVALLPVMGVAFSVIYLETTIAQSWLAGQAWYLPGMGIVMVAAVVYLLGLTVSTFIGRWFWKLFDRTFDRLPVLGLLYRTLKQLLGYRVGKEALFQEVVLVPCARLTAESNTPAAEGDAVEIGLVTSRCADSDGHTRLTVFVPAAPMPSAGRLIVIDESCVRRIDMDVSDSMKAIVSLGKTPMNLAPARQV